MKLSIENLSQANEQFVANEFSNPFSGVIEKLDGPMADGALYLPLDDQGAGLAKAAGELLVGTHPFVMVAGQYPCLKAEGDGSVDVEDGFAVQFFSKAMPGMMSGFETYATWDELVEGLQQDGIELGGDAWLAAPRAW
jgi:hypothetical protein